MQPGDLLYIPMGQYHQVENLAQNSLHWTISVAPLSQFSILEQAFKQVYEEKTYNQLSIEAKQAFNQLHPMYKNANHTLANSDLTHAIKVCFAALNEIVSSEEFLLSQQNGNRNAALKLFSQPSDELIESLTQCSA